MVSRRARTIAVVLVLLLVAAVAWWLIAAQILRRERPPEGAKLVAGGLPEAGHENEVQTGGTRVHVARVVEFVGNSPRGWQEAVQSALAEAAKNVEHITGLEVCNMTASVEGGKIVNYKADVKIVFSVET